MGELGGQKVLIEVKHGFEEYPSELTRQADEYLGIAKNKNATLMYRFYNELQSPNAKALFEYLKELYKSNKDILRIYVKGVEWAGD